MLHQRAEGKGQAGAWEGTARRGGVARPGLLSSLRQAAPGDGAGTCAEFSAQGSPVPGGWSWELEARDMNKIFPQVRAALKWLPDLGEPTLGQRVGLSKKGRR